MKTLPSFSSRLLHRIVIGAGLFATGVSSGCGDTAEGAGGAGGSGSTSTSSSSSSKASATATTSSTSGSTTATTGVTSAASTGSGMTNVERCFGKTTPTCPTTTDAPGVYGPCTPGGEAVTSWISGPTETATECCYQVDVTDPGDPSCGAPGRPFVVDARSRTASVRPHRRGWDRVDARATRRSRAVHVAPEVASLDEASRLFLGQAWSTDGAFEHASVASFGKLAMELLAFGAPSHLVRMTHEAALDEVRHAELCFGLAGTYLGVSVGPAELVEARSIAGAETLAELAAAAVHEGCFGETMAAVVAAKQRDRATDPSVRAVLSVIAEDEARHAELSFQVVAWAIAEGGEAVATRVREAMGKSLEAVREEAAPYSSFEEPLLSIELRAHGRLRAGELARERLAAAETVVVSAMRQLFGHGDTLAA